MEAQNYVTITLRCNNSNTHVGKHSELIYNLFTISILDPRNLINEHDNFCFGMPLSEV